MAFSALSLPQASVWLTSIQYRDPQDADNALWLRNASKYGIDLPAEMRSAAFLQRDFETWLQHPSRSHAFAGMRGYYPPLFDRAHSRGQIRHAISAPYPKSLPDFLPDGPSKRVFPFNKLIAWNELAQLGPETGLSRQIGLAIIRWAGQSSNNWLMRHFEPREEMASGLRQVILLGRSNSMGQLTGRPVPEIAFLLLHQKFADTAAAAQTRLWWNCSERCEH